MRRKSMVAAGFALLMLVGLSGCSQPNQQVYSECTVSDKDRTHGGSGSDMRVYTDCGVFEVRDSTLAGRFDSADVYASVRIGETYDVTAYGWRVGWLSWFPNALSFKQVTR